MRGSSKAKYIMMTPVTFTYAPGTILCTYTNLFNKRKDIKKLRTNRQVKWLYLMALESLKEKHKAKVKVCFVTPVPTR